MCVCVRALYLCHCVCVSACVRACVRARVCVCARARTRVYVCVRMRVHARARAGWMHLCWSGSVGWVVVGWERGRVTRDLIY